MSLRLNWFEIGQEFGEKKKKTTTKTKKKKKKKKRKILV